MSILTTRLIRGSKAAARMTSPPPRGFADSRHVGQAVVVQHGGHRPLPFGDHRQAALLQRPALTRPLERDHPVTRVHHRGEHRQEFLDIAVEPAEDDDGAPGFRHGVQIKGRQRRTGVRHMVSGDVVQRAHRLHEPGPGALAARIVGAHEELRGTVVIRRRQLAARVARGVGQPQEAVDPFGVDVAATCQFGHLRQRGRTDPLHPSVALEIQAQIVVEVVISDGRCGAGAIEARRRRIHDVLLSQVNLR
jgi:hypothetical protein